MMSTFQKVIHVYPFTQIKLLHCCHMCVHLLDSLHREALS
jgi:hypothetical protein